MTVAIPGGSVVRALPAFPIGTMDAVDWARTAVLFGIDGTAAKYVDDRRKAVIHDSVMEQLTELAPKLAILAPVTGRTAHDTRRMLARGDAPEGRRQRRSLRLPCVGQHGNEFLASPSKEDPDPEPRVTGDFMDLAMPLAEYISSQSAALKTTHGVPIQQQGAVWTLHLGPALKSGDVTKMNDARNAVLRVVDGAKKLGSRDRPIFAQQLRDHWVIAPGELNKGFALDWLLSTPEGESVEKIVAYDDDASGIPLFNRLAELTRPDALGRRRLTEVIRVGVVHDGAMPLEFHDRRVVDYVVPGVEGVAAHMAELVRAGEGK